MLARCRREKSAAGAAEWESKPENILFRFYGKGARLRRFSGRAKPDIIDFRGFAGFLQLHQLIVNGFQQGRFAFLHAHANLFFAEQVGQNFKLGFIRRFRQQTGEDGAVLGDGLDVAVAQGGQGQRNIVLGEDANLRETLVQGLFAGGAFHRADARFAVLIELIRRADRHEELLAGDEIRR